MRYANEWDAKRTRLADSTLSVALFLHCDASIVFDVRLKVSIIAASVDWANEIFNFATGFLLWRGVQRSIYLYLLHLNVIERISIDGRPGTDALCKLESDKYGCRPSSQVLSKFDLNFTLDILNWPTG